MIQNYLTTFLRILLRQKVYSIINVFGLAIGIAATLLIALYINDELSYDQFHKDANRIYRMGWFTKFSGVERKGWMIGPPTALALQRDLPQIESVLRMTLWRNTPIEYGGKHLTEREILLADSNFFQFFSFKLLMGNPRNVLNGPNKIVLTETAARKYFDYKGKGDLSPLGKTLLVDNEKTAMVVTGIASDPPANSHFHFNVLASIESIPGYGPDGRGWWSISTYTYFKVHHPQDIQSIEGHFPNYYKILLASAKKMRWGIGDSPDDAKKNGNEVAYFTQALTDIHLGSNLEYEFEPNSETVYLYLLGWTALFIVLLACINFMNLATARASNRAKEIGIRKSVGAIRSKLIRQFLSESFLYTIISIVFALALVSVTIGPFNLLTGKGLNMSVIQSSYFMSLLVIFSIIISLLAGIYPAFYLSSFRPVEVLKGKWIARSGNFGIRNGLVVFQFVISTSLIIATLTIHEQIQFLKTKSTGFDKENVIVLSNGLSLEKNGKVFKEELMSHPEILNASFSNRVPSQLETIGGLKRKGENSFHWVYKYDADYEHLATLGYRLKEGRFFSRDFPSDSNAVVINEAAAEAFGIYDLKEKPCVGFPPSWCREVIGIIHNFNFETLKNSVGPVAIFFGGQSRVSIRISSGDLPGKLDLIKRTWEKYSSAPFEYAFLDESMAKLYHSEEQFGKITIVFTSLAIIIACLGLLGLITYIASQRTKEIGIRKVMGASVKQIVALLSKDFTKLILIAFLMALPLSWYGITQWLETFAYRVDFNVIVAISAGAMVLIMALLTVGYQSIKAAMGNPVDSLRSE